MNTSETSAHADYLTPPASAVQSLRLTPGGKYTVFAISGECVASRREITLKTVCDPTFKPDYVNASRGKWRVGSYTERGKRKEFYLDLGQSSILAEGWELPVILDSERPAKSDGIFMVRTFSMDACLNLHPAAGVQLKPDDVRALINAAPFCPESARQRVTWCDKVLFPDAPGSHAVITRKKEAGAVWA